MNNTIKRILITFLTVLLVSSLTMFIACETTQVPNLSVTVAKDIDIKVGDSLDVVKEFLTVKYTDANGRIGVVDDYEMEGVLTEGQSVITVKYSGLTVNCTVEVKASSQLGEDDPTKEKVAIRADGTSVHGLFTINADDTLTPPTCEPIKSDYIFDGWYKDADCKIAWNFETDKMDGRTGTIYIKWAHGIRMLVPAHEETFYKEWAEKWSQNYTDSQGNRYKVSFATVSESDAPDYIINDAEHSYDVFCFASEQIKRMVNAQVLSPIDAYSLSVAKDVAERNSALSVAGATFDGKLYAYPTQAGNCNFFYYNSEVLTQDDGIFAKINKINEGKSAADRVKVYWTYDGFESESLFYTFGGMVSLTDTNFDTEVGIKALKAVHWLSSQKDLVSRDFSLMYIDEILDGKIVAGVSQRWVYDYLDKNGKIKITTLPTITIDGDTRPTQTLIVPILIGVNSHRPYQEAYHALANYLSIEEVQIAKISDLSITPTNINATQSDAAKKSTLVTTSLKQSVYNIPAVNIPQGYWFSLFTCTNAVNAKNEDISTYYNAETGQYNIEELKKLLNALREGFFN